MNGFMNMYDDSRIGVPVAPYSTNPGEIGIELIME